eukprot:scaffold5828_cov168-Amphora_coffeaeformis.AAC.23
MGPLITNGKHGSIIKAALPSFRKGESGVYCRSLRAVSPIFNPRFTIAGACQTNAAKNNNSNNIVSNEKR